MSLNVQVLDPFSRYGILISCFGAMNLGPHCLLGDVLPIKWTPSEVICRPGAGLIYRRNTFCGFSNSNIWVHYICRGVECMEVVCRGFVGICHSDGVYRIRRSTNLRCYISSILQWNGLSFCTDVSHFHVMRFFALWWANKHLPVGCTSS